MNRLTRSALLTVLLGTLCLTVLGAQLKIEQVIKPGSSCDKHYKQFLKRPDNKAFAFGRDKDTGKSRCGWASRHQTLDKARRVAVKGCQKGGSLTCHVVDENGTWQASDQHFEPRVPAPDHRLSQVQRDKLVAKSDQLFGKTCARLFNERYLPKEGHKAFAFALDRRGRAACGMATRRTTAARAEAAAIANCEKSRRKTKAECRLVARASDLFADLKEYGITPDRPPAVRLSRGEYRGFIRRSGAILPSSCQSKMKTYARSRAFKSVFVAMDADANGRCGTSANAFTRKEAEAEAKERCESARKKAGIKASCRQAIVGNKVILTVADLGIKSAVDALRTAIKIGSLQLARDSVERGAAIDTRAAQGRTALMLAAAKGNWDDYQYFIKKGADPTLQSNDNSNLAMVAAIGGNPNILRDAIARGIDINQKGTEGNTPAHAATMTANLYLLTILHDNGASFKVKNGKGKTVVELLKEARVDIKDLAEYRDLGRAARSDDLHGIKQFAQRMSVQECNQEINGLIASLGIMTLTPATLEQLLGLGGDVNYQDNKGATALMYAARMNDEEQVKVLLQAGADKSLRNNKGKRAVDIAKSPLVVRLLQ